jgi:hypothetical protein
MDISFEITGRAAPKPRMTQKDKFVKRPEVERYKCFKTSVIAKYSETCSKFFHKLVKFDAAALTVYFYVAGDLSVMDCSNCVKAIEDALIGWAYKDDSMEQLRGYDKVWAIGICASCGDKERCPGIRKCQKEKTSIRIRSI